MNKETVKTYAALVIILAGGAAALFLFFKYVFVWLLPFLFAWGVAFIVRRPARCIASRTRLPEKLLRVTLSILLLISVAAIGGVLVWQLIDAVWRFLSDLGESEAINNFFATVIDPGGGLLGGINMPPELAESLSGAFDSAVSTVLSSVGAAITRYAGMIPRIFVFSVITFISTVYFAYGLEGINSTVERILPKKAFAFLVRIKNGFISVGIKYIRSYTLIMLITFAIMLAGFLLLRVAHAPLVALFVALLDVLPVIGVGTLLLPWSVFSLVSGNTVLGVGLAILFVVNEAVRQFAEPKIVGKNIGVHPLLTLFLIYVGFGLFGFVGMLLFPIVAAVISLFVKNDTTKIK